LRAVRFTFFRSSLSSILVVSATYNLFRCNLFSVFPQNGVDVTSMVTGNWLGRKLNARAWRRNRNDSEGAASRPFPRYNKR
jgi:hypothetical protein